MEASGGAPKALRVDIGFSGGQVLGLRVPQAPYDAFRDALRGGSEQGWYELETEDAQVTIDLAQVVYVRLATESQRIGF